MPLQNNAYNYVYDRLLGEEGFRQFPYKDTRGILTLGIGRNLEAVGITLSEAQMLLRNDLDKVVAGLTERYNWYPELDDVRKSVLIDMTFNMGAAALAKFTTMLGAIEAKNWSCAARAMIASEWAVQVGKRATNLAALMLSGGD